MQKNNVLQIWIIFEILLLFIGSIILLPISGTDLDTQVLIENKKSFIGLCLSDDTFYVGGGGTGNYTTIQAAINDSNNGDTVFVYDDSSPYYENIIIDKSIDLIGENRDTTIINGNNIGDVVIVTADGVSISNFTFTESGSTSYDSGIAVISDFNYFFCNIISYNHNGIYLSSNCNNNTITGNELHSNNKFGIYLRFSVVNTIMHNNISNNEEGIVLESSSYNTIKDNIANSNCADGIRLYSYSNYNTVTWNTINSNYEFGIYSFSSSNDNNIYHNNIINNFQNAYDECSNQWDNNYPSGGNYWDDYSGVDNDGDGIGDTPYPIPGGNNEDGYPFMNQNGWIKPDLDCSGSLIWTDVKPGGTVTGTITVENIGDPESFLDWEVDSYPYWGTWSFDPDSGTDLPAEESFTIDVEVVAPNEPETEFNGEVVLINAEDPSDTCTIDVSLATPQGQVQPYQQTLIRFFEDHPNLFTLLQRYLDL